jgi:hypothetical protein
MPLYCRAGRCVTVCNAAPSLPMPSIQPSPHTSTSDRQVQGGHQPPLQARVWFCGSAIPSNSFAVAMQSN